MAKINLSETVAEEISNYILEQQLREGERLPNEHEFSELLDVSRITVREAIKILCAKGIVEIRRGVGTFVCNHKSVSEDFVDLSELSDAQIAAQTFEVRCKLEPTIAYLAAQRATDEDIVMLQEQVDKITFKYKRYVEGRYSDEAMSKLFVDHELAFHSYLAHCSQNVFFERYIYYTMQCYLSDYWRTLFTPEDLKFNLHHESIVRALREKNPAQCRRVMQQHLEFTAHWAEHSAIQQKNRRNYK